MTERFTTPPKHAQGAPRRLAVSLGELAQMVGVAESTVRSWMRDQGLPYCKVGARVLIPLSLFEKWLFDHRADPLREIACYLISRTY